MAELRLYQLLAERHGHFCPMSTLGVRLGEMACDLMTKHIASRGWTLSYQARTCAADGIRIILEQTKPQIDLQVEQLGQHLLLCRSEDVVLFSLQLTEQALQWAAGYRDLPDEQKIQRLELLRTASVDRLISYLEG